MTAYFNKFETACGTRLPLSRDRLRFFQVVWPSIQLDTRYGFYVDFFRQKSYNSVKIAHVFIEFSHGSITLPHLNSSAVVQKSMFEYSLRNRNHRNSTTTRAGQETWLGSRRNGYCRVISGETN